MLQLGGRTWGAWRRLINLLAGGGGGEGGRGGGEETLYEGPSRARAEQGSTHTKRRSIMGTPFIEISLGSHAATGKAKSLPTVVGVRMSTFPKEEAAFWKAHTSSRHIDSLGRQPSQSLT
jgi:hypothetical protein